MVWVVWMVWMIWVVRLVRLVRVCRPAKSSTGASRRRWGCGAGGRQLGWATMVTRRFSGAAGSLGFISALEPLPTASTRSAAMPCELIR